MNRYLLGRSRMHSHAQCFGHEMENVLTSDFCDHMQGLQLKYVLPPQILTKKNPVVLGVRVSVTDHVNQNSSSALAFPSLALEKGKFPQLRSDKDREGKITLQTKTWGKIITKDCDQDDGRVWVSFVCFFSKIVWGHSWHIFKCHICSVTTKLYNAAGSRQPHVLRHSLVGHLIGWGTWYDNQGILSFFPFPPSQHRPFHACGRCCAGSSGRWCIVPWAGTTCTWFHRALIPCMPWHCTPLSSWWDSSLIPTWKNNL